MSLVTVVLAAITFASPAAALPGQLDPTFGSGGVVQVLHSNEESNARGLAVQSDDKIVIAGYEEPGNLVVLRLLANGALDPGFGSGGKVVTAFPGGFSEGRAVAIQPDGKIVVAGAKGGGDTDFLVVRYNPDGSPDPGFGGGDGIAIVPVGSGYDGAEAVAIGANGKIAVTGRSLEGAEPQKEFLGVAVLTPNGTPDGTFAEDGTTLIETDEDFDTGVAVAIRSDGRLLLGDESGAGGGDGFSLIQLLPTGGFDPEFGGGDGKVLTPIPGENLSGGPGRVDDLELLGDGRIVASGYGYDYVGDPPANDSKMAVVRYLANGELDPSFGEEGIFTRQLNGASAAQAVELAENGKLLVAGSYQDPPSEQFAPAILRLTPDGGLDPVFGSGGVVLRGQTAQFGEHLSSAAVDSLDRLVTIASTYGPNGSFWISVTRFLGDRDPPVPAAAANSAPHARMKKVPRKVEAPQLKGFSGTAGDPDGDALARVQIALVKLTPGGAKASRRARPRCFALKNRRARFKLVRLKKGKRCPQRWLTVDGDAKWRFPLKRPLRPGRYVVYARAVDAAGLAEAVFSRRAGNRYAFRVLPRRSAGRRG